MTTATQEGTQVYTSPIQLGDEYLEPRIGIRGHANAIFFHESKCVDVWLEYVKDGEPKKIFVAEQRLVDPETNEPPTGTNEYRTDIVLGRKYRDVQTKLEGFAAIMEFWEHMSNRVSIRRVQGKGAGQKVKHHSIDDFHLEDVETKVVARETQPERRSPGIHDRDVSRY